ncbi:hypothetical protein B0H14DRAFT_2609240 [Mycena olivaceomarginata]|nr:hypothetical protein B0H14DRAFT_2609240 [Mycena olivaceomarginata]
MFSPIKEILKEFENQRETVSPQPSENPVEGDRAKLRNRVKSRQIETTLSTQIFDSIRLTSAGVPPPVKNFACRTRASPTRKYLLEPFCLAAFSKWLLLTLPKSFTVTVPNSANLSARPFLVRHGIDMCQTAISCAPSTTTPPHSAFPLTMISVPQLQIYHLQRSAATTEARRLERGAGWLVLQIQIPRRARSTRKSDGFATMQFSDDGPQLTVGDSDGFGKSLETEMKGYGGTDNHRKSAAHGEVDICAQKSKERWEGEYARQMGAEDGEGQWARKWKK